MKKNIINHLCRCTAVIVLLALFIGLYPFSNGTFSVSAAETNEQETVFAFEKTSITLNTGQRIRIPLHTSVVYPHIYYKSNKPDIVSVDEFGQITAVKQGIATVTAKVNNRIYTRCVVRVVIPVTSITVTKRTITLTPGQTFRLRASVQPAEANDKRIFWRTRSESVATVKNGLVTAVSNGMTIVSAETSNGCIDYCAVVVKTPVVSVTLDTDNLSLRKGETYALKATVLPETATNRTITWTSSRPDIVTVSNTGTLTAIKGGTAQITVKTTNGLTASAVIRVWDEISSITLPSQITMGLGERLTLSPIITPSTADSTSLVWSSDNAGVAAVSNGLIYANGTGRAVITVRSANGKSASCTVIVKGNPGSVQLNPTTVAIGVGESCRLKTVLPQDTASYSVRYTSDDESICTVNQSGTITGKKIGTTCITVRLFNGRTATTRVWVKAPPTAITLDYYQLTLMVGDTMRLDTHIDGNHASNKRGFTSNNTAVATVDVKGVITAKTPGTAVITAYTYNNIKATCQVTVKTPQVLTFKQSAVTLYEEDTLQSEVLLPSDVSLNSLTYTSSDTNICTVDSKGQITGRKEGKTTVTVTAPNQKKSTCTVTVRKRPPSLGVYVTQKILTPGQTFQLLCYYDNGAALNTYGTLTYSSNDTYVCRVTNSGMIIASAVGTADITVTDNNGQKAVCRVTVTTNTALLNNDLCRKTPLYENFKAVSQYPELPTGCEITALTSVLNFFGFDVDKFTMADDYLDKGPVFQTDFNEAFVGDPYSVYSYGCYAPVIANAANKFLAEQKSVLRAFKCIGLDFDSLFNFTDNGVPVILWTTLNLWAGCYTDTWTASNGKTVTWYCNEHCMVLLGDDGDKVYTADPTTGQIVAYDKDLFETRYNDLFRQAVIIH